MVKIRQIESPDYDITNESTFESVQTILKQWINSDMTDTHKIYETKKGLLFNFFRNGILVTSFAIYDLTPKEHQILKGGL
jgi:hypothetical protein